MATYLSLEDAAKQLGIPTEKLIDLRSQGQVRGFRDGSSWKFPDSEIERLKDELPNLSGFGSGILAADGSGSKPGTIIGGDDSSLAIGDPILDDDGSGSSSLELGMELPRNAGDSDVNLVAGDSGIGSDVQVVRGSSAGSDAPLDLDEFNISGPALSHDSGELDLGVSANDDSDEFNLGSSLDLAGSEELSLGDDTPTPGPKQASLSGLDLDSDESSDALADDSDADLDLGLVSGGDNAASSLELMNDLDLQDSASSIGSKSHLSGDVLSELDLLAGESAGSGLLSGDSENLLGSSLLGAEEGGSSGVDDALADDDDLIIADDDGDLVVSSMGSDISIAGDSGINLMSPSDSGLSLESEPLDLAGSSISALDLGAELSDGSGSGGGSSDYGSGLIPGDSGGSAVDFQADEEFQLSPSGIQLEASDESASQVIDIEESESVEVDSAFDSEAAFDGDVAFDEAPVMDGGFDDGMGVADGQADAVGMDEEAGVVETAGRRSAAPGSIGMPASYEIPFTLFQTIGLLLILIVMSLGGMLMTDLIRNMWSYAEPAAPVSSLTDMLIDIAGWGK
ncbi:helix-turn-helix domain-containing protein [Neorhodopirellula pilleata]|uniref:Helix-turn-helix domain protein n=1 Tax=Neorhodopirellula pilleata TaxID=2714738 RepID=A0A5C6A8B4_9BACT|nr:helix-turn-helix domain-containing protein [Neorhodopirellula pilleata]TWT95627.1 Helix-turn-helix domain protein [Neorhodopirellula pilleata]